MGCTQAKSIQNPKELYDLNITTDIDKIQLKKQILTKLKSQQNRSEVSLGKSKHNLNFDQTVWQQFSHQEQALQILNKEQLNKTDFQFLIKNQIWKEQWFETACNDLKIDPIQKKQYENQIMDLFFRVKIRQAYFLQNQTIHQILCQKCYQCSQVKFLIQPQNINSNLFKACQFCKQTGWVKNKQNNIQQSQTANAKCSVCFDTIFQLNNESECTNCNALGFIWKV